MDANPSTLPDLLTEAARLMPERVQRKETELGSTSIVHYLDSKGSLIYSSNPVRDDWGVSGQMVLEYACREECEARGWHAAYIPTIDGQRLAVTIYRNGSGETLGTGWASTPAEALLSALIQAVKGERV